MAGCCPCPVCCALGCSSSHSAAPAKVIFDKGTPFADLLVPKLTSSVTDGAVGVTVDAPVTVSVADGVLGSVTMVNENGKAINGQLSPDGLRWSTTDQLGYNRRYTLSVKALGLGGAANRQMTFQTSSPEHLTMPYVNPGDGEVVGIGEPVAIQFDENITNRAAAQKAIVITTNPPVEGAFYWLNNREVRWRPEHFWKPGTAIDVAVNTYGVDLGDGMFGEDNVKRHFTIGDEVIATADDTTKMVPCGSTGKWSRPCRRRWARTAPRPPTASTSSAGDTSTSSWTRRRTEYPSTRPTDIAPMSSGPRRFPIAASSYTPRRGRWAPKATPTPATGV